MSSGFLGLAFVIRLLPFRVLKSSGSQWRNQRPGISEKDERSFWAEPPQKHATLFTHAPAGRKGAWQVGESGGKGTLAGRWVQMITRLLMTSVC